MFGGGDMGFGIVFTLQDQFSGVSSKIQSSFSSLKSVSETASEAISGAISNIATAGLVTAGAGIAAAGFAFADAMKESKQAILDSAEVGTLFGATGDELAHLTATAQATATVFDKDFSEVAKAAKGLEMAFSDMGLTGSQAFDLVKQGLLATGGKIDLDNIYEYSTQLKQAGLTASQSIGLMVQGVQSGAYMDKLPDVIKETGLRLREMPKATKEAIQGLEKFSGGFTIGDQILSSTQLMAGLNKGTISTFEATQSLVSSMKQADNVTKQTAIADIFGAIGEDLGGVLFQLDSMNLDLDSLMKKNPILAQQMKSLQLNEDIGLAVQKVAPTLNSLQSSFDNLFGSMKLGFLRALDNPNVKSVIDRITAGIDTVSTKISEFAGSETFGMIAGLIGTAFDKFQEYSPMIEGAISSIKAFGSEVKAVVMPMVDYFSNTFDTIKNSFNKAFEGQGLDTLTEKGKGIVDLVLVPIRVGLDILNFGFQFLKPAIDLVIGAFDGVMSVMDYIIPSFDYAKQAFSGLLNRFDTGGSSFDWLIITGQILGKIIGGTLTGAFYILGGAIEFIGFIIDSVVGAITFLIDGFKTLFKWADKLFAGGMFDKLGTAIGLSMSDKAAPAAVQKTSIEQTQKALDKGKPQGTSEMLNDGLSSVMKSMNDGANVKDAEKIIREMLKNGEGFGNSDTASLLQNIANNPKVSQSLKKDLGGIIPNLQGQTDASNATEFPTDSTLGMPERLGQQTKESRQSMLQQQPTQQPNITVMPSSLPNIYLDGEVIYRNMNERSQFEGNRKND